MSVTDLKSRLADVAGIQNLTMAIAAGKIELKWADSYSAAVDATASDAEIETAIRNAIRLPPVALIPDKPITPAQQASPAGAATSTAAPASPAAPGAKTMSNPADTVGALDRVMQDHVKMMGDIHAAQLKILESTLARQRDSVANGVGNMAAAIDRQTDDFNAMMAKYTNGAPA